MSIKNFFDQNVVIRRLATTGGYKKAYKATATVEGHIQNPGAKARERLGIVEERAWIAWFDVDADVKEGDYVTDKNGKEYVVHEITKKEYGVNCHLEVLLEEPNE